MHLETLHAILALAAICDLDVNQFRHHFGSPTQDTQGGGLHGAATGLRCSWEGKFGVAPYMG